MRRESVISVASFDSLPEEGEVPATHGVRGGFPHGHGHALVVPGRQGAGKGRTKSMESPLRRRRRDLPKQADDPREAKRRKVIEEFYETEKAYVDGLELIYSVSDYCVLLQMRFVCLRLGIG